MISALLTTAVMQTTPVTAVKTTAPAGIKIVPVKAMQGFRALAFAPAPTGSRFAATFEDSSVRIIDAATRMTIKTFTGHPQPAKAIAWSADGAYLATGDETARIFIWDTRTGKKVREMRKHIRGIQNLSFNYPRTLLLSTGADDVIKVWDVSTGKDIQTIEGKGANFFSANFISKGNNFGTGILGYGARIYDVKGKVLNFLTGHANQGVLDIDFNPAGTMAVTAGKDAKGSLWTVNNAKRLNNLNGHGDWVVHARFAPNGKWAATSSSDRTVKIWNIYNYQPAVTLEDQTGVGSPLCFTADGKYLVTVNLGDDIQINSVTPPQPAVAPKPTKKKK